MGIIEQVLVKDECWVQHENNRCHKRQKGVYAKRSENTIEEKGD
jgi:hypothetical protein